MSNFDFADHVHIAHPDKLYIGGQWVPAATDRKIDVISPVSEGVVLSVAEATEEDMDRAVTAAREAFDNGPWPRLSALERAGFLRKFAERLRERDEELAHCWVNQSGILFAMAKGQSGIAAAALFDYYAELAESFPFVEEHTPADGHGKALILREPVGVVAGIVPWNGPLVLASVKIAPALLAGCTFVLKPSPEAPLDAYILAEIAEEIGLPPGVFNIVPADRAASEHLVTNPGVNKVSFTGSSAAGRKIAAIVGDRMGRYTMELGGKSAAIALDDADPTFVARSVAGMLCLLSGQVCAALTRVIVPESRHDEYEQLFVAMMTQMKPGNPYDPASSLGPLAMKRQFDRVQDYIRLGQEEGAKLAVGGKRPDGQNQGYYIQPTLFSNVDNKMRIAQEEIFGPVLCLIPAKDEADAISLANDSAYGLNGAVFTNNSERALAVARKVEVGNFAQNRFHLDLSVAFGGVKMSGLGREGGRDGLMPYLEAKTVFLD